MKSSELTSGFAFSGEGLAAGPEREELGPSSPSRTGGRETLEETGGRDPLAPEKTGGREPLGLEKPGGREPLVPEEPGGREPLAPEETGGRDPLAPEDSPGLLIQGLRGWLDPEAPLFVLGSPCKEKF